MNVLLVYIHPKENSFNKALVDAAKDTFETNGHSVRVRDLYRIGFNPLLSVEDFEARTTKSFLPDVKIEQDHIAWSDLMILFYPIWWMNMPAMAKGYIDRVLSYGFAYKSVKGEIVGLLPDKKAMIVNTTGRWKKAFDNLNLLESFEAAVDKETFNFCDIEVLHHLYYYQVPTIGNEVRTEYIEDFKDHIDNL